MMQPLASTTTEKVIGLKMSNVDNVNNYRNQISIARTEIKNLRSQILALKQDHQKEMKLIRSTLNGLRCANCAEIATTYAPNSLAEASASSGTEYISYKPIGIIETAFQNKRGVPRQPVVLNRAGGTVVIDTSVFNNPEHALSGLEEFSHMWILFHFHQTESTAVLAKVSPPRLQGERRGVFSTRSPHRPCPIGLSLVKIEKMEGNKIHFFGVDMVNGTPVLDIKPYIPQYDYPALAYRGTPMTSLERPPTEGISDVTEGAGVAGLQLDESVEGSRLSPRLTVPLGVDTSSPVPRTPYEGDIPSPLQDSALVTPVAPSPDSPSSVDILDTYATSPLRRLDYERGAPDGQERFTPPQSANFINTNHDGIRVAPWIANPPGQRFQVHFTDDALARLTEMIGERAPDFKSNIESLLSEDPRSNYVRTRFPDHEYSCVLEDVSISCVFNAESSQCTIVAVRSAEEMQN